MVMPHVTMVEMTRSVFPTQSATCQGMMPTAAGKPRQLALFWCSHISLGNQIKL